MPTIFVNGVSIAYPDVGDINWGTDATNFAIQVAAALGKIGQSSFPTTNDITVSPGNLSVTSGNLSVGGDASVTGNTTLAGNITVNGNSNLGNGTSDTTAITGILNVDSGVLYVDPVNNRVGINDATPSVELDVNGSVAITGNETVGGTLGVTGDVAVNTNKFNITATSGNTTIAGTLGVSGDVAVNTNKFNVTASSGNTTIAGTLGVTGNTTVDGVIYADDNTTANTPVLSFTGDTNTGIGRSAADTLDFITNGNSRFRIESTGQIKAVYESQVGTDYNIQLDNGYLCRAWVNFDGTGTFSPNPSTTKIRASGNVSSITDNGTGDYTVTFATAMPDVNYSALYTGRIEGSATIVNEVNPSVPAKSTASIRIVTFNLAGSSTDAAQINLGIFR